MTAPKNLVDQVTDNAEYIDALYDMQRKTHKRVKKIQRKHGHRLDSIEETLGGHSAKLDSHTATLDSHSEKLDSHSAKLDSHTATLDSHGQKLDEILGILRPT